MGCEREADAPLRLFSYYFLSAELLFTEQAGIRYGEETATVFYGTNCLAAAAGFFLFALLYRLLPSAGSRKHLLLALGCFGAAMTVLAPFIVALPVVALHIVTMVVIGYIGAAALYTMALSVRERARLGMFIALPYAGAFLLQYVLGLALPLFGDLSVAVHHIVLAAVLAITVLLLLTCDVTVPAGNVRGQDVR